MYTTVVGSGSIIFNESGTTGGLVFGRGDDETLSETANTFSGGIDLQSGLLQFAEDSHVDGSGNITQGPFGTGRLTIEGGSIAGFKNGSGGLTGTRTFDNPVAVKGNFTTFATMNQVWNGTIDFDSVQRTIGVANSGTLHTVSFNGLLKGTAGFIKGGAGTLILSHDNSGSLSGGIGITNGTLQINSDGALGDASGSTSVSSGAAIRFDNNVNYTTPETIQIAGAGTSSGGAIYSADSSSATFAGALQLTNNAQLNVASGSNSGTLNLTGTLSLGAGSTSYTLTKAGPGMLAINSAPIVSAAGGGTIVISTGTVNYNADTGISRSFDGAFTGNGSLITGSLVKSGAGTLEVNHIYNVSSLTVSGGTLSIAAGRDTAKLSRIGTFSISGRLDLNDNDLMVATSSYSAVSAAVHSGRNSGAWNGVGIMSNVVASDSSVKSLGVLKGSEYQSQYGGTATFNGVAVSASDVLVRYTYAGDADFNGQVDGGDYAKIDFGFSSGLTGWYNGDFDYNGTVTGGDYGIIDFAFAAQGSNIPGVFNSPWVELGQMWHFRIDGYLDYFIDYANARGYDLTEADFYPDGNRPPTIPALPEPTSLLVVFAGAGILLRRSRRR